MEIRFNVIEKTYLVVMDWNLPVPSDATQRGNPEDGRVLGAHFVCHQGDGFVATGELFAREEEWGELFGALMRGEDVTDRIVAMQ